MWRLFLWLMVIVILVFAGLFLYSFIQPPAEGNNPDENRAIKVALTNVGLNAPNWQTIIVSTSREINAPRNVVWETWSRLEDWSRWAPQLVKSAKWHGVDGWRKGAMFEQVLDLGFPLGKETSIETVKTCLPGSTLSWWKKTRNSSVSRLWLFEDTPGGKTRVIYVDVTHGSSTWMFKPLVVNRWEARFSGAIEGLALRSLRGGRLY